MRRFSKCPGVLLFMAILLNVRAQDNFKQDMVAVSKNMYSLSNFSVVLNYKMFLDNETQTFQTRSVKLRVNDNKVHCQQNSEVELIDDGRYRLNIDHHRMRIYFQRVQAKDQGKKKGADELFGNFALYFDSLKRFVDKVQLVEDNNGVRSYLVSYKEGVYKQLVIRVDVEKKVYLSLKAWYRKKDKITRGGVNKPREVCMQVDYEHLGLRPAFAASEFNPGRYVVVDEKGNVTLTSKYKNYKLTLL